MTAPRSVAFLIPLLAFALVGCGRNQTTYELDGDLLLDTQLGVVWGLESEKRWQVVGVVPDPRGWTPETATQRITLDPLFGDLSVLWLRLVADPRRYEWNAGNVFDRETGAIWGMDAADGWRLLAHSVGDPASGVREMARRERALREQEAERLLREQDEATATAREMTPEEWRSWLSSYADKDRDAWPSDLSERESTVLLELHFDYITNKYYSNADQ